MNPDCPVLFTEEQAFLTAGQKHPKLIANFAPVDTRLYFNPAKGPNAGPTMARVKIQHMDHITEVQLDLTRKNLVNQILTQVPTCRVADSIPYLDMGLLDFCLEGSDNNQIPKSWFFQMHGLYQIPDGNWVYVAGDTVLGMPPDTDYVIAPEVKRAHLARAPDLSPVTATIELCKRLEVFQDILFPVWGFTIAGSLRSVLSGADLTTFPLLGIIGGQNFGKTTIAQRYLLLYDDQQIPGRCWGQFDANSTSAAIFKQVSSFRDQIVLVDDLAKSCSSAEKRKRLDLVAGILRFAANDTGRAKMSSQKEVTQQLCLAGFAFTGEFMPGNASDITRTVMVPIDRQMTGGEPYDRDLAATVFYALMEWLLPRLDQKLEELHHLLANTQTDSNPRLAKNCLLILWALDLFFQFAEEIGAVAPKYHQEVCQTARQILYDHAMYQADMISNHVPLGNLCWYIMDGYDNGLFHIATDKKAFASSDRSCLVKDGVLYIRTKTLLQYFNCYTPYRFTSDKAMNKALKEEGMICDNKDHRSAHTKIKGVRCLKLSLELLQKNAKPYTTH